MSYTFSPVEHHPPIEEYLQVIESLHEDGVPVIQARIAERLGKTPASVSEMLERLVAEGYVERDGRLISLTDKGAAVARSVIRKHRLAERLLLDVIGLPWRLVHQEAGRWEHVMSDAVEDRLVALLGDPPTCPHGNPIPGSANSAAPIADQLRLTEAPLRARVRFERLTEEVEMDQDALEYLDESGFIPGVTARVARRGPDGTVVLDVGEHTIALGSALSAKLYVVAE